ncbi:MAG: B12-binding domain-containing radical SAM protein [archaeon]|nr:radical SAM protein [Nanoarchaeota archaeon]
MKILLVYPPFCTPASPPYSLVNLYSFLRNNSGLDLEVLDLNLKFHTLKFAEYGKYFQLFAKDFNNDNSNYDKKAKEFLQLTKQTYSKNNKKVVLGENPELIDDLVKEIISHKADYVAFSLVYSSQSFYSLALLKKLKELGIKTIVGGPAVNDKIRALSHLVPNNEVELLEYLISKKLNLDKLNYDYYLDFSILPLEKYFVDQPVIPIKTSSACYYQQCAFCSHHGNQKYSEFPLENVKETIIKSGQKQFFFIDDMISKKRLLQIAEMIKPLNLIWTCQLRPTIDLDRATLKQLYDSGLRMVIWGVESGCDRVLKLMRKGTNKKDIEKVLSDAKSIGIKNVLYIMFGFPTETKEEFLETVDFLKQNKENIDLISSSIFGLQKGSPVYADPIKYGIVKVKEELRTVLDPKISYSVNSGLSSAEVIKLKKEHLVELRQINNYPSSMNFFREHLLNLCEK